MIPDTIDATVRALQADLDAMPDPRDVPNSYRAQEDDGRKRSSLLNALQTIRLSRATLAEVEPQIATYERCHTHLVTWRQTLLTTLEATPANEARTYGLELSIRRIDVGLNLQDEAYPAHLPLDTLMHEAGYIPRDAITRANGEAWYGTLPYTEQRLKELTARRDDAQTRLDAVLAQHDAKRDMARAAV